MTVIQSFLPLHPKVLDVDDEIEDDFDDDDDYDEEDGESGEDDEIDDEDEEDFDDDDVETWQVTAVVDSPKGQSWLDFRPRTA